MAGGGNSAYELVQASQALQAVQALQQLDRGGPAADLEPLTQDPALLNSMDLSSTVPIALDGSFPTTHHQAALLSGYKDGLAAAAAAAAGQVLQT